MINAMKINVLWLGACVCTIAIASGTAMAVDCNNNGIDDATDIAMGTSDDCQPDAVPDECQLDCDGNGAPDDCDIAGGAADDNDNAILDVCEAPPGTGDGLRKSRYLSISSIIGAERSIQVAVIDMPVSPARVGNVWWAGTEVPVNNSPFPALRGAPLVCTPTPHSQLWTSGDLHLFGSAVVPGATYEVRTCLPDGTMCSDPVQIQTGKWGDVIAPNDGVAQPDFADITAIILKYGFQANAPDIVFTDLRTPAGQAVDFQIDFSDIGSDVDAFKGFPYSFSVASCP